MNQVQVSFHATVSTLTFANRESAKAAYDKIAAALKDYRIFKNDRAETVEIETDAGEVTLKLERMDTVMIDDGSCFERQLRERLGQERMARAVRTEMGLPDLDGRRSEVAVS